MNRITVNLKTGSQELQPLTAEELIESEALNSAYQAKIPAMTIERIERENPITHRALRELILALGELYPAAKSTPFYVRSKTADDLIKVKRAKLS